MCQEFGKDDVESIHDFELLPSRRPKILVQTAGHVSGAAFYYQRKDLDPDPWEKKQVIMGSHSTSCFYTAGCNVF